MPKSHTELIHCDNCGEDFAAAYRRCPFCNAKPGQRVDRDDTMDYGEPTGSVDYEPVYDEPALRGGGGGKRLSRVGGGGGGGYRRRGDFPVGKLILYAATALVILAAVWIISTKVLPRLFPAAPSTSPTPSASATVTPSATPTATPSVEPTDPVAVTEEPTPTVPVVVVSADPAVSDAPTTPTGTLSLSSVDFTLSPKWPTYQMKVTGATGKVTYSIGSPSVATVSDTGLVTAVANGWTVLTVTDEAGNTGKCDVRVAGVTKAPDPTAASSSGNSGDSSASTGNAKLSTEDFTLSQSLGYTAQLTVSGGTASSWSSSNENVATVSSNGTVTGHSKGTATITCTLSDGTKLTSIARVH